MASWIDGLKACCGRLFSSGDKMVLLSRLLVGTTSDPVEPVGPPVPFDHPGFLVDVVHRIAGVLDRGVFSRITADPSTDTSMRSWGIQGSSETKLGNTKNFSAGHPGDLVGSEGAAIHWGSGIVDSICSFMSSSTNRGGGTVKEAVSDYVLFPLNAYPSAGVIEKAYGIYMKWRTEGYAEPLKKYCFVSDQACGAMGVGYVDPEAMLAVNGGIHAGGKTDPGTGKIQAAVGFKSADGSDGVSGSFVVGVLTITVKNGIVTSIV